MADTTITSRALTYRDPTVSAAQNVQLRRAQQRSFEALIEKAQPASPAAARNSQIDRPKPENNFEAAQEAADQLVAEENPTARRQQGKQTSLSASNKAGSQQAKSTDDDESLLAVEEEQPHSTANFTTQQIAQEQLGIGLHVPPLQPADEAYRRAGAEPPLITEEVDSSLLAVAI